MSRQQVQASHGPAGKAGTTRGIASANKTSTCYAEVMSVWLSADDVHESIPNTTNGTAIMPIH